MSSQSYQLVMRSGPTPGKAFPITKADISIGRELNNDVVVNDPEVSRKHTRIVFRVGGFVVEDLGSTNGTYVNGQRLIGPHALQPGELILLGENISFTFEVVQPDASATVISSAAPTAMPPAMPAPMVEPMMTPMGPPPAAIPTAQPPIVPEPAYTPEYQPAYAGQVPPGPELGPAAPPPVQARKSSVSPWLWAGCGCLIVLLCVIIIGGAVIFDYQDLYCDVPIQFIRSLRGCP